MTWLGADLRSRRWRCWIARSQMLASVRVVDHESDHLAEPIHTVALAL